CVLFPRAACLSSPVFLFFFPRSRARRDLPSFPTRRSSDLFLCVFSNPVDFHFRWTLPRVWSQLLLFHCRVTIRIFGLMLFPLERSEEHTSELQSRFDLVCRLLLEKKNASDLAQSEMNFCWI